MEPFRKLVAASLCLAATGCVAMNHTEAGMGMGAGLGALTGAVIGHQSGHTAGGAVIGGLTGAVAGGLIGNAEDMRKQRDAAWAHAASVHRPSLQNLDVVQMTQGGVSDPVIISTINAQGGRFDLSPSGVISLKRAGVSDEVILAMQSASDGRPRVVDVPPAVIYEPPPPVVVVPPRPSVGVYIGPRPHWHHRPPWHHHHHHW